MEGQELQDAITAICQKFGVNGFLFSYLDGDKVKISGNLSLAEVAPLLMKYTISKFQKDANV